MIAVALAVAHALPAGAAPPVRAGSPAGVIPHHKGTPTVGFHFYLPQAQLQYFGGPVLRQNETFAIFWDPAGGLSQSYRDLVVRYLKDVAADSGTTKNVYSVLNQYYDTTGPITYDSAFAGSAVDTNPYPSGCPVSSAWPSCVTDQQLAGELDAFLFANNIPRPANRAFFVFTPAGVNTCFDSAGFSGDCASTGFCAYHGDFTGGHGDALYADIPYNARPGCDIGQHPNGNPADPALDSVSHEHRETIDDPLDPPLAWFEPVGGESSDHCEVYYGPTRNNGTGAYNQVINGHDYLLQTEWSNALGQAQGFGCVGDGVDKSPAASFTVLGVDGNTASFDATGSSDPDPGDSIASYYWTFGDGSGLHSGQTLRHRYAAGGTYHAVLYVVDTHGATASATHDVTIDRPSAAPTRSFQAKLTELQDDRGPISGSGTATRMGNVTEQGTGLSDFSNFPTSYGLSADVTLSNHNSNDRLFVSYHTTQTDTATPPQGNNYTVSGTYVVQGGTGALYNATGSGTITGTCTSSFASDIATCEDTWKGTISSQ